MTRNASNPLSSQELARYSRHILLEEIGVSGQETLKAAKVLIIGAGGLGSPASLYLAAAGVGTLGIADFDRVELHNLQRQILHGTDDVDRPKIESARETLRQINPHTQLRLHPEGVQASNAVALFEQYDVIVDGTDNFATRYLNNDAAYFAGKPLVYGSIFKFEGQASLFHSAEGGPCYRCLFPDPPPPGSVPNCGEAGVMGALCGIIGSIQAMEALKQLVGFGQSLKGKLLCLDTLSMQFRSLNLKKDPSCPLCGDNPRIRSIEAETYQDHCMAPNGAEAKRASSLPVNETPLEFDALQSKSLAESGSASLIDVREPYERDICVIKGSIHIPMNDIPNRIAELPKDKVLLVYCHHGSRSMRVVQFLRSRGFEKAANVAGGIDSWATHHEPSMQRY